VCPNEECGQEAVNKAAQKRALALQKRLAKKLTYKKALENVVLAAQRLNNSKPSGARIAILAMKSGVGVESISTFGLGGGQRFVQSPNIQEAFTKAMQLVINEEQKATRRAKKEVAMKAEEAQCNDRGPYHWTTAAKRMQRHFLAAELLYI
jgi:hypothetical protein